MSEPKFTPGPWELIPDDGNAWREIRPSNRGDDPNLSYLLASTPTWGGLGEFKKIEAEANAHLIASAPEMYEMLKKCISILDGLEYSRAIDLHFMEIYELLKKARGGK